MSKPIVIGLTRFSVDPASIIRPELLKDEADLARRQRDIYQPERLASRWSLFNHFALPSLIAAAAHYEHFFHLLAYSTALNDDIRAKLRALGEQHAAWLRLVAVPPEASFGEVTRVAIRSLLSEKTQTGDYGFNFRIDDDDVLSPDFVDAVLAIAPSCSEGQVVSFDRGQYLQRAGDDAFFISEVDYPKIAIGLGIFCTGTSAEYIFDMPLHQTIPDQRVVNIRDRAYWVRVLHSHSDSGTRAPLTGPALGIDAACAQLAARYGHLPLAAALRQLSIATETKRAESAPKVLFGIQ